MIAPREALDALGQIADDEIDIADAALQFARIDRPEADLAAARAHLTEIARAAAAHPGQTPVAEAVALTNLMAKTFGYRGDASSYDDLRNANLLSVIERRRGLPVALGILWIHAARAAGWTAQGVNFPGHFLVGLGEGRGRVFLDVFAGGRILDETALQSLLGTFEGPAARLRPQVLAPVSDRDVLLRLQNNIKLRRLRSGDIAEARVCNADMLRLAPGSSALWRDAAQLADHLEEPAAALAAWQRVLALVPEGGEAESAREAVRELRSRLH